jgi:hypothetical protein
MPMTFGLFEGNKEQTIVWKNRGRLRRALVSSAESETGSSLHASHSLAAKLLRRQAGSITLRSAEMTEVLLTARAGRVLSALAEYLSLELKGKNSF